MASSAGGIAASSTGLPPLRRNLSATTLTLAAPYALSLPPAGAGAGPLRRMASASSLAPVPLVLAPPAAPDTSSAMLPVRARVRRALRRFMIMQRLMSPRSIKGVPLLTKSGRARLPIFGSYPLTTATPHATPNASPPMSPVPPAVAPLHIRRASTPTPTLMPSLAACKAAAEFVEDARHGRLPDVRRAQLAGDWHDQTKFGTSAKFAAASSAKAAAGLGVDAEATAVAVAAASARSGDTSSVAVGAASAAAPKRLARSNSFPPNRGREAHSVLAVALASTSVSAFFAVVVLAHCMLAFYEFVPHSVAGPAFSFSVGGAEAVFLAIYIAVVWATYFAFGAQVVHKKRWEVLLVAVTLLCVLDWLIFYGGGLATRNMWRFSRPLRPFLALAKLPEHRRLLSSLARTMPLVLQVAVVFLTTVVFFGVLGVQLFNRAQVSGYSPKNDHFDSPYSGILASFVLSTTENFPSVLYPALRQRPAAALLFFLPALLSYLWLLLPLLQAIVYKHFAEMKSGLLASHKVKSHVSLVFAFQTLASGDGDAELSREAFEVFLPHVRPGSTKKQADLLFAALDVDGSGAITIAEWLRLLTVLEIDVHAFIGAAAVADSGGPASAPGAASRLYAQFCSACQSIAPSRALAAFGWLCLIGAAMSGMLWSMSAQEGYDSCMCIAFPVPTDDESGGDDSALPSPGCVANQGGCMGGSVLFGAEVAGLVFQLGAALELLIHACAHRPDLAAAETMRAYWGALGAMTSRWWVFASAFNLLDALIVVYGLVGSVALLAGAHDSLSPSSADWFEASRAFRVLRVVLRLPAARGLLGTLAGVLPQLAKIGVVYASLVYAFALVGQAMLAGVGSGSAADQASYFSPVGLCQKCQEISFDTLPETLLQLLALTVGNNWNSILYPNVVASGQPAIAIYFSLYRFVMMDILVALITSIMLDSYTRQGQLATRAGFEEKLARSLLERSSAVTAAGGGGTSPVPTNRVALWAHPELLSELADVEDRLKRRREQRLRPGPDAPETPSWGNPLDLYGISRVHLEHLDTLLRQLESGM